MKDETENTFLLEIARCRYVHHCLTDPAARHPCGAIVGSQSKSLDEHQVPEPWLGDLAKAPLLFISSNPSISLTEDYPRWSWSDDELLSYFNHRFSKWIHDGISYRNQDGTFSRPVRYWISVRRRARELYDREVIPGLDYALTEIVHCKSEREVGVKDALNTCADRYLSRMLSLSQSRVVVIVGQKARDFFVEAYHLATGACAYGPTNIAGRDRFILFIAAPSAWGSRFPKTFGSEEFTPFLRSLRNELRNAS